MGLCGSVYVRVHPTDQIDGNIAKKAISDRSRSIHLLLVGLDGAGKSTLVEALRGNRAPETIPTAGIGDEYRMGVLQALGLDSSGEPAFESDGPAVRLHCDRRAQLVVHDVGGARRFRHMWPSQFSKVHGVVAVVDATAPERFQESADALRRVIDHEASIGKPLIIFANKWDQADHSTLEDVERCLETDNIVLCRHRVVPAVALPSALQATAASPKGEVSERRKAVIVDPNILHGMRWLAQMIDSDMANLAPRVENPDRHRHLDDPGATDR